MSLLTDKTMREKIAEKNPYPNYVAAWLSEVGDHVAYMTGVDATLAMEVAGVPLSELIEKAESGKLMELEENQRYQPSPPDDTIQEG